MKDGLEFEIKEAFKVTVNDGGKEKTVWTTGGTVKDLLAEEEISYDKSSDDKIKPELDKELTKDTEIEIIRVEKSTDEVTVKVPFDIEKEEDSSLAKGEEKVLTPGEEGTVVKKYEVTLENGEEVNRELVSEDITEECENQIVAVGTKAPELEAEASASTNTDHNNSDSNSNAGSKTDVETDANNESSGKTITVTASAYTASCSGCSGKTATGIDLSANPNQKVIAVDPNVIPLGSKVHVEGYGEAIAADTGGGITGNRIDVHVPTKEAAYNWGKRSVQVKVLD